MNTDTPTIWCYYVHSYVMQFNEIRGGEKCVLWSFIVTIVVVIDTSNTLS